MSARPSPAILIVEDEQIVAIDLQQSLDEMGYDAFAIASSAEEAVACATLRWPDVVLMDIRIKGADDGIRTAALLKQKFPVIVIYLTAHTDGSMLDRAKRTEPHGYLVKPVKDAELHSMIEIALYKRQLDAERDKVRSTLHRLHTITDNVPIAIAYFDRLGKVQFANHVFRDLVPYQDDPIGVAAMTFLGVPLYRESYPSRQRALLGEQSSVLVELKHGGDRRKLEVTYLPDADDGGAVHGVYAIGYDVTERERLSAELRQAHADLQTIVNAVPASITSWHRDLTNRFANSAARARYGILSDQMFGRDLRQVLGDERFEQAWPLIQRALAGEVASHEHAEDDESGSARHSHSYYIPEFKDGAVAGLYALTFDITELRRSHEQIRRLLRRLETVREEERRAVSVALHDGIAQDLFALKLGLDHLLGQTKRRVGIQRVCRELGAAVAKCMEDIRQIANELRPVALAYFGVTAAITEHARKFAGHSNLKIDVSGVASLPKFPEATELLLLRAAQEALTNVARHARATAVDLSLGAEAGHIMLRIADDGVGIEKSALSKPRSLGLLGLRERFEALGGGLTVENRLPHGTLLTLRLPRPVEPPGA